MNGRFLGMSGVKMKAFWDAEESFCYPTSFIKKCSMLNNQCSMFNKNA